MVEKTENTPNHTVVRNDYDIGPLTPDDAGLIFDRFAELARTANESDWGRLCAAVHGLFRNGYEDPRVLPMVRARYADAGLNHLDAEYFLRDADPRGSQPLFLERAKLILKVIDEKNPGPSDYSHPGPHDLSPLLEFLDKSNPECIEILLRGMDHRNAGVRIATIEAAEGMPKDKILPRLIAGLTDADERVRQACAAAFMLHAGEKAHLPMLKQRLAEEKSEIVQYYLRQAIEGLAWERAEDQGDKGLNRR
jgi:hypothetical protein